MMRQVMHASGVKGAYSRLCKECLWVQKRGSMYMCRIGTCVFKSNGDSVFPCYCVFQSRGLLIEVPERVML